MANFKYKARDKFAKLVSGVIASDTNDQAAKKLQEMGYTPISIQEVRGVRPEEVLKKFRRVKREEINTFTRQLYSLQKAGLPLLDSLDVIAQQTRNEYFSLIIQQVARDVRGGMNLSESLRRHPKVFDDIYVNMIKSAETGGAMVEILGRLTELIEQEIDTRQRISAATRYPMIAFFTLVLGFLIVVTFVIPRFASLYSQFDAALPLPTRILIGLNLVIRRFWYLFILGLGGAVFGFISFIRSEKGKAIWDNFKLKIPVFGQLIYMLVMSRFARVTSILMKSGVPILDVLGLVRNISNNVIIARAIDNIRKSVNQGKGMSEPMKISGLFPPIVIQMVSVGERTGRMDELLLSVADYYDRESGYMIKNLTTYIEPILIFILGVMVLVMALGIFMPMWNLINVFKPN